MVYEELRKLAAAKMAQENPGQTLQATALVHEAYIRLVDVDKAQHWNSRGHFFGAAAEAMRRILLNRARDNDRQKRGGQVCGVWHVDEARHAFVDTTDEAPVRVFSDGTESYAYSINSAGTVVGHLRNSGTVFRKPLNGNVQVFDGLASTEHLSVNDAGEFVAYAVPGYFSRRQKEIVAIRYTDGVGAVQIAASGSKGMEINNHGDAVGLVWRDFDQRMFHYSDDCGVLLINDIIDGAVDDVAEWFAAQVTESRHMNDSGVITGRCLTADSLERAFLLLPVYP